MKKLRIVFRFLFSGFMFAFAACSPKISLAAAVQSADYISVKFSTSFPEETAKALRQMTGAGDEVPIFAEADIKSLLLQAEAEDIKVSSPSSNELSSSAAIKNIAQNVLSECKIIEKNKNSLSLSLGPEQFQSFYSLLSDEFKSYFDLMMIPCLIGEKMPAPEYEALLSSMYGPAFAKDIVSGNLEISLSSPDGKKNLKDSVSLGEILTLSETKTWKLSW